MSPVMQCYKCRTMFEPFPLRDIGTYWEPVFAGNCPECGEENQMALDGIRNIDEYVIKLAGPEQPPRKFAKPIDERVMDDEVKEYWIQQYVAVNFKELGFDALQGPMDIGPDFRVKRDGRWIVMEAEVACQNYLKHKHHENHKWATCEVLIVLESNEPTDDIKQFLPKTIIHLDKSRFLAWYEPVAREYALAREAEWPAKRAARIVNCRLDMLAREIRKRFGIHSGGEYSEDLGLGAIELSQSLTLDFVARWMDGREDLLLSEISAQAIDDFCASVAPEVNAMLPELGIQLDRGRPTQ